MDPQVLAILAQVNGPIDRHVVQLTLSNVSNEVVLIDPYNLCADNQLREPVFKITDANGHRIKYTGRIYKRGEPNFDSFYKLKPGTRLTQTCTLDGFYDFSGSKPPYKVQYSVYNMHPTIDYFEIKSETLTLAQ